MRSTCFELLRAVEPRAAALGGFAEAYARADPALALRKLRRLAEWLVTVVYAALRLPRPPLGDKTHLSDLLDEPAFRAAMPEAVWLTLHALRKQSNDATRGYRVTPACALVCLEAAFELASWVFLLLELGPRKAIPAFVEPPPSPANDTHGELLWWDKRAIDEQAVSGFPSIARLFAELDQKAQARGTTTEVIARSPEDLSRLRDLLQKEAGALHLTEVAARRRLVDLALRGAGYRVGLDGESTGQVGQRVVIPRKGSADYVIWGDDGKPLGVVEVNPTPEGDEQGGAQAARWADGLEKVHGRRPIVYSTTGIVTRIWDGAQGSAPRKIDGFHSQDGLEHLFFQRSLGPALADIVPDPVIAGRPYQVEAVQAICRRLSGLHRRALVFMATGTGKTRVAVSLCEALLRVQWARRILFLVDGDDLLAQAEEVFQEHLPGAVKVVVKPGSAPSRDGAVYLATHVGMAGSLAGFETGFFDLLICDEMLAVRRQIFAHFDAPRVGLTAAPRIPVPNLDLFSDASRAATVYYSFETAVSSNPPAVVPFRVVPSTARFVREEKGFPYQDMTPAHQAQLAEIDRQLFDETINSRVIRDLIDKGARVHHQYHDAERMRLGKTIIFAKDLRHAVALEQLVWKLHPQFGGMSTRVVDNDEPRNVGHPRWARLVRFKKGDITIGITTGRLEAGIDRPEVVNLVLAKPVRSLVELWQMLGRGVRLCPDLLGPGKDKTEVLIFDPWGNLDAFDIRHEMAAPPPPPPPSTQQVLFEACLDLTQAAFDAGDPVAYRNAGRLVLRYLDSLRRVKCINVKEQARRILKFQKMLINEGINACVEAGIRELTVPLMRWYYDGWSSRPYDVFDLATIRLQLAIFRSSGDVAGLRAEIMQPINRLYMGHPSVKERAQLIRAVRSNAFWDDLTVAKVEELRNRLMSILCYTPQWCGKKLVVVEDEAGDGEAAG